MTEAMNSHHYTNKDIEEIMNNGFDYSLPQETILLIENLSKKVGAPSYIKTPNFQKKNYKNNYKKNKHRALNISETDWESIRNFKATEIKKKEGNDIYIDNIKRSLNKITDNTYSDVRDEILGVIAEVTSLDSDNSELLFSIGKIIFTIASQNKFYSKLYAKLYSELKDKIEIMGEIFGKSYNEFIKTFEVIEYVEAEDDYDKFCLVNRDNDNRKAMSLFIVHLISLDMVTTESGIELTEQLIEKFKENIEKDNCDKVAEEICENLFIIITNCEGLNINFQHNIKWDAIIDYIKEISEKEADDYPSLTNKIIFKCMDIIEEIA